MYHLLLVDDSRSALTALTSQLDSNLFFVVCAESAAAAFEALRDFQPDCILTDYEMPEVDGPSFCRELKSRDEYKAIPLIMLTSKADTADILLGIESGADDYVTKTSDVRVIVAKIKAMLRLKGLSDELSQLKRAAGIREIIATYNHEFNNPLTIAIGNLLQLRTALQDEAQLEKIKQIQLALERMVGLVRKIRDLREYVDESYGGSVMMMSLPKET